MRGGERKAIRGIVLRVMPYGEGDNVVQLFSRERGLLSCFVTRSQLRRGAVTQLAPLQEVEGWIWRGGGELWRLEELSIETHFAGLRLEAARLQAAGQMAHLINVTQQEERGAPLLYQLTVILWSLLQEGLPGATALTLFAVKLLVHEGLFSERLQCDECGSGSFPQQLTPFGSLCSVHGAEGSLWVTERQWHALVKLASVRQFNAMASIEIDDELLKMALALVRLRTAD